MSLYSNLLSVLTPYANKIKQNEIDIRTAMSLSGGAPIVVGSASEMTDTDQIYVLSTDGYWYYYDGTTWTAGGEYGAVATDTTLTQPGIPADAKAVGDAINDFKDDLNHIGNIVFIKNDIDLTTETQTTYSISASTGLWASSSSYNTYFIKIPDGASELKVKANVSNGTILALLTSNRHVVGGTPDYAAGWTRTFIFTGETILYEVPEDAKYLWIAETLGANNYAPEILQIIVNKTIPQIDNTLSISGDAADAKSTGDQINTIKNKLYENSSADLTEATIKTGLISSDTGNWVVGTTAQGYSSYFVALSGSEKYVTITANNSYPSIIAILTTDSMVANTQPNYATGCRREFINASGTKVFEIPEDAKYLAILYTATGSDYTPESVVFKCERYTTNAEVNALEREIAKNRNGITHEKPNSEGELNVVRRCRQLTDIKWTPVFDIPRISQLDKYTGGANDPYYFEDVFKAGVEYTGIPYGQANKNATRWGKDSTIGFKLGWEIGLDTFMSAIGNSESVVAKESTYQAQTGVHRASFYATVCTALTGYALNLPEYYPTNQQGYAPGMVDMGVVSGIDLEDIHLGDMLWNPTHGGIITDKLRDNDGEIIAIEISEATTIGNANWNVQGSQYGGICRRRMWNLTNFAKWGSYHLYRYNNVDNTPYTPSPYVDTGDEGNFVRIVNFPVVPYMGENFKYVKGYIYNTKILTPAYKEGYTNKLRVKKDGVDWNVNGTTDYYDVSGQYVEVGFSEVGSYEAYLCQVENDIEVIQTKACHWTVEGTSEE